MSRLEEIRRAKERRKERLTAALASIIGRLRDLGALKVILFGSLAEDEVDVHSDLDLLVVMPATRTGREWAQLVYDRIERSVAADIIVYNEREFLEELPVNSFLQEVVGAGRIVYEKTL